MMKFRTSDVVSYVPLHPEGRDGFAVVVDNRPGWTKMLDTYTTGHGNDVRKLTYDEMKTAQVMFNFDDMRELEHDERHIYDLARPENRGKITHLNGLATRLFIRHVTLPDPGVDLLDASRAAKAAAQEAERVRRDYERMQKSLIG